MIHQAYCQLVEILLLGNYYIEKKLVRFVVFSLCTHCVPDLFHKKRDLEIACKVMQINILKALKDSKAWRTIARDYFIITVFDKKKIQI